MKKTLFVIFCFLYLSSCFNPRQLEIKRITVRDSVYSVVSNGMPLYPSPTLRLMYAHLKANEDNNAYFFAEKRVMVDEDWIPYPLSFGMSRIIYAVSPILPKKRFDYEFYMKMNKKIDRKGWIWYYAKTMKSLRTKGKYIDKIKRKIRYSSAHPQYIGYPCCSRGLFSDYFKGKYINQICSDYIEMPKYQIIIKHRNYTDTFYLEDKPIKTPMKMLYHRKFYQIDAAKYKIIRSSSDSLSMLE